ncbi:Aminopeptidase 2 mitochondrial [Mortierella sp. GBA30]|nr:Aminopeptidase 2 mitochondrial [Mortierella sp. GBA30]
MSVESRLMLENGMQEVTFVKTPIMATYLDLVAVPDFSPGAMENWGLITFRMHALLLAEDGAIDRKREIAATVIHEISHQWFGNLVTMDWWSDLWLFEGFATHLAYIVVDELFPSWDIWSEFVKRIQEVLKHDALRTSHPVEVGVANPSEITQIFDEVSYMKGASVLRMLDAWLGQEQLMRGIRKFLMTYMWGNANTEDLWVTLAEECKVDVPGFMRKWTRQTGYPVISITELDASTILIRQNLFLSTGDVREQEDTLLWPVPLALATAADPTSRNIMMDTKELVLKVDTTQWYKFNMGQTGFYRVSYPPRTLNLLGQTLLCKKLSGVETLGATDRVGLLTDAAALVASGDTPTSSFLTLLKYFEDEHNYMVWVEIALKLQELFSVWLEQPMPIMNALKEVQRRLFTRIVKRLGWTCSEGEDPLTGNLRALAIRYAGRAGDPDIVAEAKWRFEAFMKDGDMSAIPPDLRFPVFEIVLRTTTGSEEYDEIVDYYREAHMPDEKMVALTVLGYGHTPELIRRTLAFAMSPEVRTQDILTAIATLRSSVSGRAELWDFMRHHWDVLFERHCDDIRFLDYFVLLSIGSFSSIERYREVQEFFVNKDTSLYGRILATCLEGIRMHILWLERDREDVEQWLRVNGYLMPRAETERKVFWPLGIEDIQDQDRLDVDEIINDDVHQRQRPPIINRDLTLTTGRSSSNSSARGLSASPTDTTVVSGSSATSSCSSSPPRIYTPQHQCQHLRPQLQYEYEKQQQEEQLSRSQLYVIDDMLMVEDQNLQLQQRLQQQGQWQDHQRQEEKRQRLQSEPLQQTCASRMTCVEHDLEAKVIQKKTELSAATAAAAPLTLPAPSTLESEMELLHTLSSGATAFLRKPSAFHIRLQARNVSVSALNQSQDKLAEFLTTPGNVEVETIAIKAAGDDTADNKKTPYRSARYLLELSEREKKQSVRRHNRNGPSASDGESGNVNRRFNSKRPHRLDNNNARNHNDRASRAASRFQAPPTIPYDSAKELQFADKIDWEVSSVLESRPAFANVAAGRGTAAPLGISNTHNINNVVGNALPGVAISAHISGVRSHGDLDPEVEQSLVQELTPIQGSKDKDHRKASDVSVEHQKFLFHQLTGNFQEIMNPRNEINRFNNGNVKHMESIKYVVGSDEIQTAGDQQAEKSWKRLERLGGDYSRASTPWTLIGSKYAGKKGRVLLDDVSQLIGQNQSIGLEDKKKFLKAVEHNLGGF